jgi:hypothetical protein
MYVVPISAHATYCLCLSLHVKSIVILFPSNSAWAQVLEAVMYQEIHSLAVKLKNLLETEQDRNVMLYADSDIHFCR